MPDTNQLYDWHKELEKRVENLEKEMDGTVDHLKELLTQIIEINQSIRQGFTKL